MNRKEFILLTITTTWLAPSCKPHANPTLTTPLFLSTICDTQTLKHIGAAYRKSTPSEAEENKLIDLLSQNPTKDNPARQLEAQISYEYAAGRTVTIDGWILSLTEARQCALYSLQNK